MAEAFQTEVVVGQLLPAWFAGYRRRAQDLRISPCVLRTGAFAQQLLYQVVGTLQPEFPKRDSVS